MYASDGFSKIAEDSINLLNEVAAGKPERELRELEEIIVKTSNFEYMFWDMAENKSMWPVEPVV